LNSFGGLVRTTTLRPAQAIGTLGHAQSTGIANTDRSRVDSILEVIENALSAEERERSGLNRRVKYARARAAVTISNGTDEYLKRDALDSHHYQDLFSTEISNGQRRLK
jgi:hypothetical protein